MLRKLKIIILSRLNKPKYNSEIKRRRSICLGCKYNSGNSEKANYKIFIIRKLSRILSFIFGKIKEDNLNECLACGCSLYYKTQELEEDCIKGYWK